MYIIIECMEIEHPCIVTDYHGKPLIFETREEATQYSEDIHSPVIVKIF